VPVLSYLRRLAVLIAITCAAHMPAAHAALLDFRVSSADAVMGESVSVDIVVSGLGDFSPDSLGAFDVSVAYDPVVFALSGYTLGAFLGDPGSAESLDASAGDIGGSVNIAQVSLLANAALHALQPGEFALATLDFDVLDLAIGATSQLSFAGALLGDTGGSALPATSGGPATFVGRAEVPTPATALLLLGGLLSLRAARRR
tara:strand:- start:30466 stop:31071 length:606 start_codon:yes stop_codon:yes gene_type:complete